ncbi:DUF302 domain-containing protein [Rhizobium leguminosarum]|jgi:uncharacterized protein (DUF302 family)|uniref:DUF302 domain-containing protein n=1 Tax=Rhizobium leguminosarum TaxID=384 RepID=UPI001C9273BD|nr:DUF302 domain-containing protein [Rhizobium leguminosarum]MBY2919950.1 DUF302 domain-containing protein [Rhizobium leguminosarum]MBY2966169.1 DUF302 domain-containing protein [Rhizobium leguminosarum]MBY2985164.1 DUF302 domain-containing protein [Rhizobium leguminosarum]MBY3023131.1 DUF302 domain-containing protein [Rhizobium leguminosarum]
MTDSNGISVVRTPVWIEHIRIVSKRSFDQVKAKIEKLPHFDNGIRKILRDGDFVRVKKELERLQGSAGLIIFSVATHGDWLAIRGGSRHALQYVIGNVLISSEMTKHQLPAGLYAPLRIMLYENEEGTATLEYDRPSDLFGQFNDDRVTSVAEHLDQQIYDCLVAAAA